jgi:hypothetical protein
MAAAVLLTVGEIASQDGSRLPEPIATEDNELWVTSQGTDRLFIVHGNGSSVETVPLPTGAGPHITTFSPFGDFAYVAGMGNGDLFVLKADDRQLIQRLDLGPVLTHQAKSSPDGSILLVTQIATARLIKIAVDEAAETWTVSGSLSFTALGKAPICTVFRDDGQHAYVSLRPNGIAIVDVPTMTLLGTLPTDGFVACGMIKSKKGRIVTVASSGSGGHIYRLDTLTETLTDNGTLGAADWHSFAMSRNEKVGFGSSPGSDEIVVVDLTDPTAANLGTIALDPTPGIGNDQPDAFAVRGDTVFASLRASGQLAIIKSNQRTARFVQLSPPAPFNEATCGPPGPPTPNMPGGCAVHGVAIRP